MREVTFIRKASDLAFTTTHLLQSSSASRVTAAQAGFFILSQSGERTERYAEYFRFDTIVRMRDSRSAIFSDRQWIDKDAQHRRIVAYDVPN